MSRKSLALEISMTMGFVSLNVTGFGSVNSWLEFSLALVLRVKDFLVMEPRIYRHLHVL